MPRSKRSQALNGSNDKDLFKDAMRNVKPLNQEERVRERKRPPASARQTRAARDEVLRESLTSSPAERDTLEQFSDEMAYRHASLPNRIFKKLRRGHFSIEAEADLHGLSAAEAKLVLQEFIVESCDRNLGCVRVIHGKGLHSGPGGAVLKIRVQRGLTQWDEVLAFVTARAQHGGSGAVYVLLRHR